MYTANSNTSNMYHHPVTIQSTHSYPRHAVVSKLRSTLDPTPESDTTTLDPQGASRFAPDLSSTSNPNCTNPAPHVTRARSRLLRPARRRRLRARSTCADGLPRRGRGRVAARESAADTALRGGRLRRPPLSRSSRVNRRRAQIVCWRRRRCRRRGQQVVRAGELLRAGKLWRAGELRQAGKLLQADELLRAGELRQAGELRRAGKLRQAGKLRRVGKLRRASADESVRADKLRQVGRQAGGRRPGEL